MRSFLDLGFLISVPGTVTFPKAEAVRAVVRAVPEDALLIETDAPVLAPQSHRGRRNEPAYLVETAAAVAALRGVSLDALAALTDANARRLFRLTDAGAGVADPAAREGAQVGADVVVSQREGASVADPAARDGAARVGADAPQPGGDQFSPRAENVGA